MPTDLFDELTARGVRFVAEGDKLKFVGKAAVLTDETWGLIRRGKPALLARLALDSVPLAADALLFPLSDSEFDAIANAVRRVVELAPDAEWSVRSILKWLDVSQDRGRWGAVKAELANAAANAIDAATWDG